MDCEESGNMRLAVSRLFRFRIQASGADPFVKGSTSGDLSLKGKGGHGSSGIGFGKIQIHNASAFPADKVNVCRRVRIEVDQAVADADRPDLFEVAQQEKVAVNGSEADVREAVTDAAEDDVSCRMIFPPGQEVPYGLTLPAAADLFFFVCPALHTECARIFQVIPDVVVNRNDSCYYYER